MMHEFALIQKFFSDQTSHRSDVVLGIGDDAAVVTLPAGQELAITTDTLISGVHFPESTTAYDIGHKALAVNLSDLAAMGATPAWVTLALSIPSANEKWLKEFTEGFFSLADQFKIQLIGGDMTRAPLSVTVGAYGFIPKGLALTRSGAKPGDLIYVSNFLGDGGLALRLLARKTPYSADQKQAIEHLNRPYPQIKLGEHVRGIAHSAIDISDGLAADLGHILQQSNVGATINVDHLPLSHAMRSTLPGYEAIDLALTAGDDFELCFTVPPERKMELEKNMQQHNHSLTHIGFITAQPGLVLQFTDGKKYEGPVQGYQHF